MMETVKKLKYWKKWRGVGEWGESVKDKDEENMCRAQALRTERTRGTASQRRGRQARMGDMIVSVAEGRTLRGLD